MYYLSMVPFFQPEEDIVTKCPKFVYLSQIVILCLISRCNLVPGVSNVGFDGKINPDLYQTPGSLEHALVMDEEFSLSYAYPNEWDQVDTGAHYFEYLNTSGSYVAHYRRDLEGEIWALTVTAVDRSIPIENHEMLIRGILDEDTNNLREMDFELLPVEPSSEVGPYQATSLSYLLVYPNGENVFSIVLAINVGNEGYVIQWLSRAVDREELLAIYEATLPFVSIVQ
jgi:hypothetical protein